MRSYARFSTLVTLGVIAGPLSAQNVWNQVPAYPTACYTEADSFDEAVDALQVSLSAAIERQRVTNEGIRSKYDNLDDATRQSRVMALMQRDPAAAQRLVQQMQAMATPGQDQEVSNRGAALVAKIKQAIDAALAEAKQLPPHPENATDQQIRAWVQRYNAVYLELCENWFSSGRGRVREAVVEYHKFQKTEYAPLMEEKELSNKKFLEVMGIATADYIPTANMEAVNQLLLEIKRAYGLRHDKPQQ